MMSGRTVARTRVVNRTSRLQDLRYQEINNRSDAAVAGLHPECRLLSTHRERAMGVSPSGPEDPYTGTCVVLKKIFARKASGHSQRGSTALDAMHWQVIRPEKRFDTESCRVPRTCVEVSGCQWATYVVASAHRLIGDGRKLLRLA